MIVNRKGFTLAEIMVVIAIIGLLAAIAVPNFVKSRAAAQKTSCIANLKQIAGAKQMWAIDQNKTGSDVPGWDDLVSDDRKKQPLCPAGGSYTIGDVDSEPTCDYGNGHNL
jgi:prepilin-type N-terminal cleavage/methylation domain-containing protein